MSNEQVWFDGQLMAAEDAKVSIYTHALHYGSSVFEGIRVYDTPQGSCGFRITDHIRRLFDSAKIYRWHIPFSVEELLDACREVLAANQLSQAYIRPLAFIGNVGLGLSPAKQVMQVSITASPWGAYLGEDSLEQGVDAVVTSWNRLAPNTMPTAAKAGGNYLSSQLISGEARRHGYDEGIALDVNGFVSEGAGENLFIVKNGKIYTPPLTSSILPGLTRDSIMTMARHFGYEVVEAPINRDALYLADELFMTGTAAEVVPVRSVDRIQVGNGKRGPVTTKLQSAFFGLFNGQQEDRWGWLEPMEQTAMSTFLQNMY